ncbi:unknown (plasmid) [Roseobacter denitrificans OCh 114]|uniref:Transposase IS66 central domain-containing protein n=1 Tax=Roseobacter denitrificans (strain ATCC 33942 / OCh 114) TaxID=375451 RepID=Q07GD7_ROSDO|nr:unknown [Roseobacter denitrificans OCh 114]
MSDGRIEMDSNAVEHTIRPIVLQRKNALFSDHDAGAQNWAMLASLIEIGKLNDVEPHSYLTSVLSAIVNGHKQKTSNSCYPGTSKLEATLTALQQFKTMGVLNVYATILGF